MKSIRLAVILLCLIITSCIGNNSEKRDSTIIVNKEQIEENHGNTIATDTMPLFDDNSTSNAKADSIDNYNENEEDYYLEDVQCDIFSLEDYIEMLKDILKHDKQKGMSLDSAILKYTYEKDRITADSITKWWNAIPYK